MRLEEILERNQRFAAQREAHPLPPPSPASLLVVSCFDPRLRGLMEAALGLDDASLAASVLWFKTAGAFVARGSATSRSLLVKVFLFQVPAVVVVGHSSCRMASFDTDGFIRSFRERGVKREALGTMDLREWAGAIPSPRHGVELTMGNILSDPACPSDLSVQGAVLDDTTGILKAVNVIVNGATTRPETGSRTGSGSEPEPQREAANARKAPPPPPPPPRTSASASSDPGTAAVEAMARVLRSSAKWRYEVGRLRKEIARARTPASKLRLLGEFVERTGGESRDVGDAYRQFVEAAKTARDGSLDPSSLLRQLEHLVAKL